VEHEGRALAADETDASHHRAPGVASVHVRAVLTWCAIFPLVALGMTFMAWATPVWPPLLKALVLTAVVVPLAVYLLVPQLLRAHARASRAIAARRRRRS
jgi:antibiotic biosynthesis monooxygenase (ABM) superfamily enzyme